MKKAASLTVLRLSECSYLI